RRRRARGGKLSAPLLTSLIAAEKGLETQIAGMRDRHQKQEAKATEAIRNKPEKAAIKKKFEASLTDIRRRLGQAKEGLENAHRERLTALERRRDSALQDATTQGTNASQGLRQTADRQKAAARASRDQSIAAAQKQYDDERGRMDAAWRKAQNRIERFLS